MNIESMERTAGRWRQAGMLTFGMAMAGALLLGGCEKREETAAAGAKGVIRIAIANEDTFRMDYADYFAAKFPDLDVEIIPTLGLYDQGGDPVKKYMDIIDEKKPDLLFTDTWSYGKLAASGRLYDLSPLIAKDKFDLDNLLPAAVDYLQIKGQGKLYGLAPKFSSSVLFYNKDLFDRYRIPYPAAAMTWEDMLRLAQRFPAEGGKEERVYGFHMGYMQSPLDLIQYIGQAEGLAHFDASGRKLIADTDGWRRIYRLVLDGYKSGALQWDYSPPDKQRFDKEDVEREELFGAGRAAMTISTAGQVRSLRQREAAFAWDMTPVPSADPAHRQNPDFYVYPIFSIGSRAENVTNAWEVIKYFNGAEAAKIEMKTELELPVRQAFAKEIDGHSLEPFYRVKYEEADNSDNYAAVPMEFGQTYRELSLKLMDAMLQGGLSVEEGLRLQQEQGQRALDEAQAAARAKAGEAGAEGS
ncbi:extracellular solute-binding protein [Paenibacillus doosanensis]|uniref:Bacterial extracellular solute-binding protein n=1 Tax=Paenibacillus konkukensis TaxID=2020716 RepID=A0ABY4RTK1_9BACL|nr:MULTISPECIES: extracellular solute-binding protein [Paenibacillus]MCS7461252.1 extracellular solute-binding protein [Paenibacillus doosanensis]UQZ85307.1 Bacterial extracellular solute-binding protein [Paenibacillus konkukensis]